MKLLIISYIFPPCATGAGSVMYNLLKDFPAEEYVVITPSEKLYSSYRGYDEKYSLNCNIIRLPVYSVRFMDQFIFSILATLRGIFLCKKEGIQGILSVYPWFFDMVAGYALHKLLNKPLIIWMHDLFSEAQRATRLYKIWFQIEKKVFSSASKVIVMHEKYVEHYLNRGIQNIAILPPSLDLRDYEPNLSNQKVTKDPTKLRIVYNGTVYLLNEKAVSTFLKATEKLDDIEVIFTCPDNESCTEDYVRKHLRKLNVGFLPKKEFIETQKSADVFLVGLSESSIPEELQVCIPSKTLSYLAAGKPILALVPRGSYMESLINENEVGIVVNDLSVEKTMAAINLLKDDKTRALFSTNALKTAKLFDSRKQCNQFIKILHGIDVEIAQARVKSKNV